MLKRERGNVSDWLVEHCSLSASEAEKLEERLRKECFVDSVGSLRQCASRTPEVLDKLKLPRAFLLALYDHLEVPNRKPLNDVTVSEVSVALVNILPKATEYASTFFKSRVTGFVLSRITTCEELMGWGVKSKKDALVLLGHISSWRTSGIPKHYLRVMDEKHDAAEPPPVLSPRKRQKGEIDENPNNDSSLGGASSGSAPTAPAPNFSLTAQLALLSSGDEKARSRTLEELLKSANKDHSIVDMFAHTGMIDKLLSMRKDPAEGVVYNVLILLNLTIQKGDEGTQHYLIVERNVLSTLGPKLWTISHRVRMGIVRIVHSVAHTTHAQVLLQTAIIQGIASMYFTSVTGVTARDAEETRHRTAQALQTLCRAATSTRDHLPVLLHCLPVLRDVLEVDHNHRVTLPSACAVLGHIMRLGAGKVASKVTNPAPSSENHTTSSASSSSSTKAEKCVPEEIVASVLPKLTTRVNDKKGEVVVSALSVLSVFCECCREDQLSSLSPTLKVVLELLQTDTEVEVRLAALRFVLSMAQHGGETAVGLMIAADVIPALLDIILAPRLHEAGTFEEEEGESEVREVAARSFLAAAQSANETQLGYFLRINIYSALLNMVNVLAVPRGPAEVVLQVVVLLRDLVLRVQGIDEEELSAAEEQKEVDAWVAVQKITSGDLVLTDTRRVKDAKGVRGVRGAGGVKVEDQRGVEEVVEEGVGKRLREAAGALIRSACALGILEAVKPAQLR